LFVKAEGELQSRIKTSEMDGENMGKYKRCFLFV
jgi:hypothetical protein